MGMKRFMKIANIISIALLSISLAALIAGGVLFALVWAGKASYQSWLLVFLATFGGVNALLSFAAFGFALFQKDIR